MNNIPDVSEDFIYSSNQWREHGFRSQIDVEMTLFVTCLQDVDFQIHTDQQSSGRFILFSSLAKRKIDLFKSIMPDFVEEGHPPRVRNKGIREREVQTKLSRKLGGATEVWTPCGRIDLLTEDTVFEIKRESLWREGMGQLLAYAEYYPERSRCLVLFDGGHKKDLAQTIEGVCCSNKVQVKYFKSGKLVDIRSMFGGAK